MRAWPLALLALAFAQTEQTSSTTKSDAQDPVQKLQNALAQLKTKVGGLPPHWDTDMGLPEGWSHKDVVKKCTPNDPLFDSTLNPIDCVKLFPHVLEGYLDEIKQMEEEYQAQHPPPLTPLPDDDAEEGAPTSFLETFLSTGVRARQHLGLQALIDKQRKATEMEEARDELMGHMTAAQKEHVKKESAEIMKAMQTKDHAALKRLGLEGGQTEGYTNRLASPINVEDEIKRLGRMSLDLNREYVLEQKRNAPIIADLKDVQEQEKIVQREQREENEAMISRAKERARVDWERAHTPPPPRINPGRPDSPGYAAAVARLWTQAETRAQEESKHAAEEKAEEMEEMKAHLTPGPAARLQAKLSARLAVDDEELEGMTPTKDQLVAAGFVTTTPPPANSFKLVDDSNYRKMMMHVGHARDELQAAKDAAAGEPSGEPLLPTMPKARDGDQAAAEMTHLAAHVTGRTGLDVHTELPSAETNMRKH